MAAIPRIAFTTGHPSSEAESFSSPVLSASLGPFARRQRSHYSSDSPGLTVVPRHGQILMVLMVLSASRTLGVSRGGTEEVWALSIHMSAGGRLAVTDSPSSMRRREMRSALWIAGESAGLVRH